jgi:hypothetical protein
VVCVDAPCKESRGEMVRGRVIKGLLLFILPAAAECAPTLVDRDSSAVVGSAACSRVRSLEFRLGPVGIGGGDYSPLAAMAVEFHKPSVRYPGVSSPAIATKSLPAVPGALLMVVVGFVCVSVVRDCRAWLAVATCLLWAGQSGFSLLPRVALRVAADRQWAERFSGRFSTLRWRRYLSCEKLDVSDDAVPLAQVEQKFGPVQSADVRRVSFETSAASSLAPAAGPAACLASTLVRTNLARGPPSAGLIAHVL